MTTTEPASTRPGILVFDVNETLLDTGPLKQKVGDLLQDPSGGTLWFTTMLHYSLVLTVSGQYKPFPEIGAATLQMLARNSDVSVSHDDAMALMGEMKSLTPHPDVEPALTRLRAAGFQMATLTNSSSAGVAAQIANAGLDRFFQHKLSVEATGKFKPDSTVYEWAARTLGTAPHMCMLVAAHGWDVAGAAWAGMRTAFVARPGQQKLPLAPSPELDVSDLHALAAALGA